jgi:hypothetical protein
MMRKTLGHVALAALVVAAGVGAKWFGNDAAAQTARPMPMFDVDAGWPKVPMVFKMGDVSSIAIDDKDNAWVLSRPRTVKPEDARRAAPPIMIFDSAGNFIRGWGGQSGAAWQWPEREHGILVDSKGFVWLGGNSCPENGLPGLKPVTDDQLLKFRQDGTFVMQIGNSSLSKGNADTANLHRPADAQFVAQTNELFVADGYGNHRVIVFDADTGAYKRMWGAFGNKPVDDYSCAVVNHTNFAEPGPQNFSIVHAIRVAKDGMVYVADRENRRVQSFTSDGKFVKQLLKGDAIFARDLAFSADADQQFLYTGYDKGIAVIDRKSLEYIGTIQPQGILGAGHHIQTDSKGNLYIAQTAAGMQRLLFKGMSVASR